MTTAQNFQLIDGTFTPDEARRILGAMVKGKIDFHSLEKHSKDERSAEVCQKSEERLAALRDLDAKLKALFGSAEASGKKLEVKGTIEISPVD